MNAYKVMVENGPHKSAVEVTGLRLDYEDEVENLEVEKEGLMEDALKWREKKDELGSLVEEFKEKLKNLEIEKEDAAK